MANPNSRTSEESVFDNLYRRLQFDISPSMFPDIQQKINSLTPVEKGKLKIVRDAKVQQETRDMNGRWRYDRRAVEEASTFISCMNSLIFD